MIRLATLLMVHVKDDAVIDVSRFYVDAEKFDLIGRMEGGWYTRTRERFEMPVVSLADWTSASGARGGTGDQSLDALKQSMQEVADAVRDVWAVADPQPHGGSGLDSHPQSLASHHRRR